MPAGLRLARRLSRRRLLHLRHGRGEPHPRRPSRVRRLAGRDVAPGLRAAHRRRRASCGSSTASRSVPPSLCPATPPSAGRTRSARCATPATRSATTATCTRARARRPTPPPRNGGCCAGSRRCDAVAGRAPGRLPSADVGALLPPARAPGQPRLPVRQRADGCGPSISAGDRPGARGASIIELPGHWSLDDWEPYNYLPGITGSGVIASPADVLARWTLELEALVAEGGLFMLTNHPFICGRASRAAALETLIDRAKAIDGLWIARRRAGRAHVATLPLTRWCIGRTQPA